MIDRRGFLTGLVGVIAAPAVVKIDSLMPISFVQEDWLPCDGRIVSKRQYPLLAKILEQIPDLNNNPPKQNQFWLPNLIPSSGMIHTPDWRMASERPKNVPMRAKIRATNPIDIDVYGIKVPRFPVGYISYFYE